MEMMYGLGMVNQSLLMMIIEKKNVHQILPFEEYEDLCFGKVNNKIKVVDSIKQLNEMLHADGINEKLRSQFVGTCLLALKNNLSYKDVKPSLDENGKKLQPNQIVIQGIQRILSGLLSRSQTLNKAGKLAILNNKVFYQYLSLYFKGGDDIFP